MPYVWGLAYRGRAIWPYPYMLPPRGYIFPLLTSGTHKGGNVGYTHTMSESKLSYCRTLRLLAWTAVACVFFLNMTMPYTGWIVLQG